MKSELDLLIDLLEAEKQSLESLIKANLDEHEYLNVHHYGEALIRINGQLYMLNCFKDPFYDREQRFERMLNFAKLDQQSYFKTFWEERIATEKEEIQQLRSKTATYFNDTQEIDDALFKLFESKYNRFRLHFAHRGEPFYIEFRMENEQILNISVELNSIVNNEDPDDLEINQVHLFKNLGFKLNSQAGLLIYRYDMEGFKDAIAIKRILARIIYDIGYWGDEKQAKLEYFY